MLRRRLRQFERRPRGRKYTPPPSSLPSACHSERNNSSYHSFRQLPNNPFIDSTTTSELEHHQLTQSNEDELTSTVTRIPISVHTSGGGYGLVDIPTLNDTGISDVDARRVSFLYDTNSFDSLQSALNQDTSSGETEHMSEKRNSTNPAHVRRPYFNKIRGRFRQTASDKGLGLGFFLQF